jgi:hypothetical protein
VQRRILPDMLDVDVGFRRRGRHPDERVRDGCCCCVRRA